MAEASNRLDIVVGADTKDAEQNLHRIEQGLERVGEIAKEVTPLLQAFANAVEAKKWSNLMENAVPYSQTVTKDLPAAFFAAHTPGPQQTNKAPSASEAWSVFYENDQTSWAMRTQSEWEKVWNEAERKFAETVAAQQQEAIENAVNNGTKYFTQYTAGDFLKNAYKDYGKSAKESASVFQDYYNNLPTSGDNWGWSQRGKDVFAEQFQESGKSAKESAAVFEEAFASVENSMSRILPEGLAAKMSAFFTTTANQAEEAGRKLEKLARIAEGLKPVFTGLAGAARLMLKTSPFPYVAKQLKDLKKPLENFARAFKRIVMYRVIRGGLTAVLKQWKEGFKNLYGYSVRFGTQFRATMDSLATDMQYLGNGFAAMVAPLANAIAPAIQAIADKVVALANAIGYFFAKILGQGSFSAAIRGSAKAFDDMGGSAKEARKQLMGFDELNVLTDNKGGGGKTPADYSKMFEEWSTELEEGSIEQRIREAIENSDWEGLGGLLAEKMNGLVSQFKESNFGKKIGQRIEKGLEIAHGFLKKFDFKEGGAAVAANLNQTIDEIDWYKLGETLNSGITGAFDLILGFIEEFDWHQFSESFSNVIKGWFDHLSDWIASVDWVTFGKTFFDKVYEFITGIDFGGIATSFFTCLGESLVALFGVVEGFLSEMWVKWNEYCGIEAEDSGLDVIGKFLLGIWNALVGIATWVYDNIVAPFFNALRGRDGFGLDGDGGDTEQTGEDVIGAFLHGLTLKWEDVKKWVLEKVSWFKTQLGGLKDWLTNKNGTYTWTPSMEWQGKYYAEGGTVPTGQLFIANEAGPELVGTVGGQTTVTSQDQFTAGMADIMEVTNTIILQAAQLVSQTVQNKNMTAVAVIGDREVVSAYDRGKTLAGYALVE